MKQPKRNVTKLVKQRFVRLLQFLFRHGEKIIAAVLVLAAIGLAARSLHDQPLSWEPDEMETLANNIENTIRENEGTVLDAPIRLFDYAGYAELIKQKIPAEPYRVESAWKPVLYADPVLQGDFEVFTAETLRCEAVRRSGSTVAQWKRPPLPEMKEENAAQNLPSIWVNIYGTVPAEKQAAIYNQIFNNSVDTKCQPEYVYYELEKTEISPKGEPVWQPVIVYPAGELKPEQVPDEPSVIPKDRLVPFAGQQGLDGNSMLLFSDFEIEPAKTYSYRIRLYLVNPNYNVQAVSVEEGVDTKSQYVRSDWSPVASVYVPDRTQVRLVSVIPTDNAEFPRQTAPLRAVMGTLFVDYFDIELGQALPPVEKTEIRRGMLANVSKIEANKYINRGKNPDEFVNYNYPDAGLRSDVCIMDFSGGRKLQKKLSKGAQSSPDLFVAGKALLLMPDGTMQVMTTAPDAFK